MNPDYPINSADQDRLGRASISRRITEMLITAPKEHSVVFGMSGPWGSGKTSLLNMVKEQLDCYEGKLVVVPFNPWSYPSFSNLVVPFFDAISDAVTQAIPRLKLKGKAGDLAKLLLDYARALSSLADSFLPAPLATALLSAIGKGGESFGKQDGKKPEELKRHLVSLLEKSELQIVVMIDDLDRLPNEGVRSVFQLVAAIADFPCVSYILAYDRENVAAALSAVQGCDGNQYLEKIVQVPIELPEPSPGMLQIILADELDGALASSNVEARESIELGKMCILIKDRLHSVRDIYRLTNLFEVEWGQSQGKIAPPDLLGMVALRVFVPAVIPWMTARRSILCGSVSGMLPYGSKAEEKKTAYLEELGSYLGEGAPDLDFVIGILCALFPRFAGSCGMLSYRTSDADLKLSRRIASTDIFDHYFTGLIEAYSFPREEALRLLASGGVEELVDFLSQSEQSVSSTLLTHIADSAGDMPHERAQIIARAVIRCNVIEEKSRAVFRFPFSTLEICLERLLRVLGKDSAGALLREETCDMEFSQLANLARFLFGQENAFGRLTEDAAKPDTQLITLGALEKVESNFKRALESTKPTVRQLTYPNAASLLGFWNKLDVVSYETNVTKGVLSDPFGYLVYCTYWLGVYSDGLSNGWAFPEGIPADIDIEKVKEGLSSVWLNEDYWCLPESFRKRIVALSICIKKMEGGSEDYYDVKASEAEVELRMQEWKNSIGE